MKLTHKSAVVTGASTGIGKAIAQAFAAEGAHVFLIARSKDKLQQVQDIIEDKGGTAEAIPTDLSNLKSINKLIETLKQTMETVDIIANIAGVWHEANEVYADKDFSDFNQEVITATYNVGLVAPTLLVHGLIPMMPPKSKIINLSGTFENGAKGWLPYYVSKKGIEDLTVGLAEELTEKQIQVNGISPSDTATEAYIKYFPEYVSEAIQPEAIAKFAVFLASNDADVVNGKIFVLKNGVDPFEAFHL